MKRRTLRENVVGNFEWDKVQKHRDSRYEKIEPEELFQLLDEIQGGLRTQATKLLYRLASRKWHIHYTAHEGGSDPNSPLHILLMAPRGIHLDCRRKKDDTLYIVGISKFDEA